MSFRPVHLAFLGVPAALIAATLVAVTGSSGTAAEEPKFHRPAFTKKQPAKPEFEPNTVLVKFKKKATTSARKAAVSKFGTTTDPVTSNIVELKGEASAPELLKKVKADPTVELASLNYRRWASAVPNDPYYNGYQKNSLTTARVPQAWDLSKSTGSQIVAVIDTGVDAGHPDLAGRLVPGYNATSPNRGPIDDNGHGTMTLGIIAAGANNGIGVAGVGWAAKAMPVKVLDSTGSGWDVDIAEGIDWAVAHGAKVINMSLGGPGYNAVLEQSIQNAYAQGVVLVAASGNEGSGEAQYPAAFSEVFAVGATDPAGTLTEFSSYGDWVDLAAPGWDILSTYPRVVGDPDDVPYAYCTGTSCSAPIVAGIAALVRNKYPTLSADQVETRLRSLARDAGPRGKDKYYGFGVVDAFAALGGRFTTDFPGGGADGNDQPARAAKITSTATAAIETEGDVDWYAVDSAAARNLKVTVTPPVYDVVQFPTNIGPVVDVYDENLKLLGHDQNVYPHNIDPDTGIPIPEVLTATSEVSVPAGTAYIAVRNSNGSRDGRTYKLDVAEGGAGGTVTGPAYPLRDTTPVDRTSNVAATVKPTVTFARDVDNPSLSLMDAKTGDPAPATGEYVAATRTWTFTPTKPLNEATTYRISGTATEGGVETPINSVFSTADLTPQAVTGFTAAGNYLAANLSWGIPATPDLDQVIVRYNPNSKTPTIDTGTLAYAGTGSSVKVTGLAQGVTYTFAAWVKDRSGKVSPVATKQLFGTRAGISTTSTLISYGGTITLKGSMLRIDNKAYPGEPILLLAKAKNATTFTTLATLKAGSTGAVSFAHKPTVSTMYAIAYLGNAELMGARTVNITVEVMPTVTTILSPTTIKLGQTTKFSGVVTPAHNGKLVYLQLATNGSWKSIASVKQSASGAYAFGIKPATRGTFAYRIVHPADADHAQTVTGYKNLKVS